MNQPPAQCFAPGQLPCSHERGFTLIELLVVIAIIALLAAYVGPRMFGQVEKSETKLARSQIDAFTKALAAYRLDSGHFPVTSQGLKALVERPNDESRWNGPYLDKAVPDDPWGRPYVYRSPGEGGRDYDVSSFGKDGTPGGDGVNADILSWE